MALRLLLDWAACASNITARGTAVSRDRTRCDRGRPRRGAARARAGVRSPGGARGARLGERHPQVDGLAPGVGARATRTGPAGRAARAPAPRPRDPPRRRAQHARAQPRGAGPADAGRAGRGQWRDDQPRRPGARGGRARRAGGRPPLPWRRPVARALGRLPLLGQRQGVSGLRARRAPQTAARGADPAHDHPSRAADRRARAGPPRGLRGGRGRAGARPGGDRGTGARSRWRGDRRPVDHRPDGPHDPGPDRRAATGPHRRGAGAQRPPARPPARRERRMTHEEILKLLYDETLVGNAPAVADGVRSGLEDGLEPERMLYDALIPSLEEVGARFERGDYFVPEMLIAARAMQGALDILRPLLAETGTAQVGTFLMGTVKGDVHDIGKNLCNIMLEGAGFTVIDLGVNVAPERFISEIETHHPDIVGFSAFLTTTMPMFKANINALEKAGIREDVIVMVGGAPVTQEYADAVGADGYSADASSAVKKAKELLQKRRARVPA